MKPLLHNSIVALRALEPEDIDTLYRWENDTRLWVGGTSLMPYSKFSIKQYIADAQKDIYQLQQLRLMINLCEKDPKTIGTVDLFDFDFFNQRAGVGILIDTEYREKGYGFQALQLLTRYAFEFLNLHQLFAHIPVQNSASREIFEKVGFEETGELKQWIRFRNQFENVCIMQLINFQ